MREPLAKGPFQGSSEVSLRGSSETPPLMGSPSSSGGVDSGPEHSASLHSLTLLRWEEASAHWAADPQTAVVFAWGCRAWGGWLSMPSSAQAGAPHQTLPDAGRGVEKPTSNPPEGGGPARPGSGPEADQLTGNGLTFRLHSAGGPRPCGHRPRHCDSQSPLSRGCQPHPCQLAPSSGSDRGLGPACMRHRPCLHGARLPPPLRVEPSLKVKTLPSAAVWPESGLASPSPVSCGSETNTAVPKGRHSGECPLQPLARPPVPPPETPLAAEKPAAAWQPPTQS